MEEFCKIYNSEKLGQMLVIMETDDKGQPVVFLKFTPEGMGVCGPTFSFSEEDEDIAWDKAEKAYEQLDKDLCERICQGIVDEYLS